MHMADVETFQRRSLYTLELQNGEVLRRTLHLPHHDHNGMSTKDRNRYIVKVWRSEPDSIHAKVVVAETQQWSRRYTVVFGLAWSTGTGHTSIYEGIWSTQEDRWKPKRILSAPKTIDLRAEATQVPRSIQLVYALEAIQDCLAESVRESLRPEWFSDSMCRIRDERIKKAFTLAKKMIVGREARGGKASK